MQIRYACHLTGEEYVTEQAWLDANLPRCPLHPKGGCGFARHGTYERVSPPGTLVSRWYCPRGHQTSYLIGFIDDATRVVPALDFALPENTRTFLPVLKQAIRRCGLPQRLYVDNGANYRSRHLALVCARLGITLIHARPYRPQGKGKIERFSRPYGRSC